MITPEQALAGRSQAMSISGKHAVNGHSIIPPFARHLQQASVALGCFWGAERRFWQQAGVVATAVGYTGGYTANPTYQEVCSGNTGHAEAVLVIFDAEQIRYTELLALFWQYHNPTQGMRQGNDIGSQYRSAIYSHNEQQLHQAMASRDLYQAQLTRHGYGQITTEIAAAGEFYYAEEQHQQYLAKNPHGYCGSGGLNIPFTAGEKP